jgi:hypothetical protein
VSIAREIRITPIPTIVAGPTRTRRCSAFSQVGLLTVDEFLKATQHRRIKMWAGHDFDRSGLEDLRIPGVSECPYGQRSGLLANSGAGIR